MAKKKVKDGHVGLFDETVRLKKLKDKEAKALEKAKVEKAKEDNKTKKVK